MSAACYVSRVRLFLLTLATLALPLTIACGEAHVRIPEATGWGTASRAAPANELYPARYPRFDRATLKKREDALARELPGFQVALSATGFFSAAVKNQPVEYSMSLEASEIVIAQRFIDAHPDLFGLTHREQLKRWHDGLYYISEVDDPRYGIALIHARQNLTLAGHFWPGLTMRSSARKDPRDLLGPWLGRKMHSREQQAMPCDPVSSDPSRDCPGPPSSETMTIAPESAHYVVYAYPVDGAGGPEIRVREILTLPQVRDQVLDEPEKGPIPTSVDARTGETLPLAGIGAGMCEDEAGCAIWGWFDDPGHLDFDLLSAPFHAPLTE